jgi:(1->4)-alpha-D-glucan 1-alpha-D-glucosylmutase
LTAGTPAANLAIPRATYRLQLSSGFTFTDAITVIPYLAALGISHVYCSPFLKARPGSSHGYDITDHNALNPEIGSMEMLDVFCRTLAAHGMGLILDFVPNHMGIGQADNAWWLDVLERGQNSVYADFFDIDWQPPLPALRGKVLLPFLGDHYGAVLERGELTLKFDPAAGSFSVWYHEHRYPVRARSYAGIIRRRLASQPLPAELKEADKAELQSLAAEFDRLRRVGRRQRAAQRKNAEALKRKLADLSEARPVIGCLLAEAAEAINGTPGEPGSFGPLHSLLERQFYRLAYWRVAADEINYRRFFNINDLVGIRIENPALFDIVHRFVGQLIGEGKLHGLRLDHIDGLFDPEAYCRRLREFVAQAAAPDGGGGPATFYIVVEKILARHEKLRTEWPVAGTTGYDFTNLVNGLFVDPSGHRPLERIYRNVTGLTQSFDAIALAAKDAIIDNMLSGELNVLARELDRIGNQDWGTRDYTEGRLRRALKGVVAHFPVYRTYVAAKGAGAADRRDIDWAVSQAAHAWTGPDSETLTFVHQALTGDLAGRKGRRAEVRRFARRFQQYTSPVTAKSLEDTSFYRYNLLLSLNEVGGDPRQFGTSVAAFHEANRQRLRQWPDAMLATSTHDTKRGEDARIRIDILSEIPEEWERRVRRWMSLNRFLRRQGEGGRVPSRNDGYRIYHSLVGAWPVAFAERPAADNPALAGLSQRMQAFAIKSAREAKLATSWADPKPAYEEAYAAFVARLFDASRSNPFLDDFAEFHAGMIAYPAMLASLSQLVMKLTVPGVPDIYQGADLWDLSLVDPDNRRPVDFGLRETLLQAIASAKSKDQDFPAGRFSDMLAGWRDGRIKLFITQALLGLRAADPELFRSGSYEPLQSRGERADHVIAFTRRLGERRLLVMAGRLFAGLVKKTRQAYDGAAVWGDTAVGCEAEPVLEWTSLLTGECIRPQLRGQTACLPCARALKALPVGVFLARERP